MNIELEADLTSPPHVVFPYIAEPEKAIQWQRNVKRWEVMEDKPEVVGTTFKEVIEEDGNCLEMQGVITKYIENREIGFHLESRIHTVEIEYLLQGEHQGSSMRIAAEIRWKFPMSILNLILGQKVERGLIEGLKSELSELKGLLAPDPA
jgi:hypothetical protein